MPAQPSLAPLVPARIGPALLVGGAALLNLVDLRTEVSYVPLLNDGSVHSEMVRSAEHLIASGRLPLAAWFPYLQLGSPQFLHYQSLGAMLTGLVGVVAGSDRAYAWSLYLLVSLWPLALFGAARVFGLGHYTAACAAVCSAYLVSVAGVGYEQHAYLYVGFGVWSQLFAMWTLPYAWAYAFRAVTTGRARFLAVLFISLTMAFHFETGYLALLPLGLFALLAPTKLAVRGPRAVLLAAGALVATSWVLVPLLRASKWAALNESLQHTYYTDSYGARQVLTWLVQGNLTDAGRLPVVTVLAGIGLLTSLATVRHDERARALVALFGASLLLFFGRTTFGALVDVIPGSEDLFLRRFMIGVQLAMVLFAGIGATATARWVVELRAPRLRFGNGLVSRRGVLAFRGAAVLLFVVVLIPAWTEIRTYDAGDSADIATQQHADVLGGTDVGELVAKMATLGPGRVYAGLPDNWGSTFDVGLVPVFKYLSALDVDVVGYTLRTASLMSGPEANFDEANPADFDLFGVRYLFLPAGHPPPVAATEVDQAGSYVLWDRTSTSYLQVVETSGILIEDRADIKAVSSTFLFSSEAANGLYPTVAFAGAAAADPTLPSGTTPTADPGSVQHEVVNLAFGEADATVRTTTRAVVLLKSSFDPGWTVTVDGRTAAPYMVGPALVGVTVGPGRHTVRFTYRGPTDYPLLFAISAATLALFAIADLRARRRRRAVASSA